VARLQTETAATVVWIAHTIGVGPLSWAGGLGLRHDQQLKQRCHRGSGKTYSIDAMSWGIVELEPEVREWLEKLPTAQFATAAFYIDLVAEQGPLLSEPYTRQLDGKLRELRFHLDRAAVRLTYWIAPGRRIVLLTVFVKTRMREDREVARARRALARCIEAEHEVEEEETDG